MLTYKLNLIMFMMSLHIIFYIHSPNGLIVIRIKSKCKHRFQDVLQHKRVYPKVSGLSR
jgi:uncharacterized protein (UPF0218 family)